VEGASCPTVNNSEIGGEAFLLRNKDIVEIAGIRIELGVSA